MHAVLAEIVAKLQYSPRQVCLKYLQPYGGVKLAGVDYFFSHELRHTKVNSVFHPPG